MSCTRVAVCIFNNKREINCCVGVNSSSSVIVLYINILYIVAITLILDYNIWPSVRHFPGFNVTKTLSIFAVAFKERIHRTTEVGDAGSPPIGPLCNIVLPFSCFANFIDAITANCKKNTHREQVVLNIRT